VPTECSRAWTMKPMPLARTVATAAPMRTQIRPRTRVERSRSRDGTCALRRGPTTTAGERWGRPALATTVCLRAVPTTGRAGCLAAGVRASRHNTGRTWQPGGTMASDRPPRSPGYDLR
jgi:hypothetical protein